MKNFKWLYKIFFLLIIIPIYTNALQQNKKPKFKVISSSNVSSIVVDAETGKILHFDQADKQIFPASITKVMTLYLTFEAIKKHKLDPDTKITISKTAAAMPASKIGFVPGEQVRVKDLIYAVALKSANDAARALGEAIGGDEESFAKLMNIRAKQLGMQRTNFKNSSGWHHIHQKTNAVDLVKLAIAIKRDYPNYYKIFALKDFNYRGRTYYSHNNVTKSYVGAEGLKTGYTVASGYNLVTSASKNGRKLVAVVTGGRSAKERDAKMIALLDTHFGVIDSGVKITKVSKIYKVKNSLVSHKPKKTIVKTRKIVKRTNKRIKNA